jgi:hypothetical protein
MPTALARVRRLDCRGECLLVRVKLPRGSTKAADFRIDGNLVFDNAMRRSFLQKRVTAGNPANRRRSKMKSDNALLASTAAC